MYAANIKTAIRQTERWMLASKQDRHPAIALLHANYAVGNIDLIRQLYSDAQILNATGIQIHVLSKDAAALQDAATSALARLCPSAIP